MYHLNRKVIHGVYAGYIIKLSVYMQLPMKHVNPSPSCGGIQVSFIVKTNISMESSLVLYADDILLYRPICTREDYSVL